MRRLRIPIVGLMGLVFFAALGFAALRSPTVVWASALFTLAVVLFCGATVVALMERGPLRYACTAFAVFGWAYLIVAFGPGTNGNGASIPPLITKAAIDALRNAREPSFTGMQSDAEPHGDLVPAAPPAFLEPPAATPPPAISDSEFQVAPGSPTPPPSGPPPAPFVERTFTGPFIDWQNHRRIGHVLSAIGFAFIGGLFGCLLATRKGRTGDREAAGQ